MSKIYTFALNYQQLSVMTMQDDAYLKCIDPQCGLEYPIKSTNVQCEKGHMLDVKYKNKPSDKLKEIFSTRVGFGDLENY